MRALFGSGWWILWHLAFYAAVLVFVVLTLAVFGQELKASGEKPDTMSPGSALVFMISIGLAALTLVNGALFSLILVARWPFKALVALAFAGMVLATGIPLNDRLASAQSRSAFYANILWAAAVTGGNLMLTWLARTQPRGSLVLFGR